MLNSRVTLSDAHKLLHLMYQYTGKVSECSSPLQTLSSIKQETAIAFASFVEGTPRAYMIVEPHKEEALILQTYSIDRKCTKPLFSYTCNWLKEQGFHKVVLFTHRSPRAVERATGLKLTQYKLEKELIDNEQQVGEV